MLVESGGKGVWPWGQIDNGHLRYVRHVEHHRQAGNPFKDAHSMSAPVLELAVWFSFGEPSIAFVRAMSA